MGPRVLDKLDPQSKDYGGIGVQILAIGVKDAAALLGVSQWAIRRWIKAGKLRAVRLGRRILIEPAELQRLVEQGRTEASR